jgi:uncharacterized protein (DUF1697 family)
VPTNRHARPFASSNERMLTVMALRLVRYVAFVRAVMVGRKGLSRALLLDAFECCGAENCRSFLATGNVIFRTRVPGARFARRAAEAVRARTGIDEPIFLRTPAQLRHLIAEHPFARAPRGPHHERTVTFLPSRVRLNRQVTVSGPRGDVDVFSIRSREAFAITRLVAGRAGNPGLHLERLLGVKVTTRNWNTIVRLLDACAPSTSKVSRSTAVASARGSVSRSG